MASALTLLPDPLSPTSATVSPLRTFHDTPSTARTTPALVWNWVRRPRTSRRTSMSGGESTTPPATVSGSASGARLLDARQGGAEGVAEGVRADSSPRRNQRARCADEPWVQVSGLTRPPACFCRRSSPTAAAAARPSSTSPGSRRSPLVVRAPDARRSSRPAAPAGPTARSPGRVALLRLATCSVMPSRFWTWWPTSWAIT